MFHLCAGDEEEIWTAESSQKTSGGILKHRGELSTRADTAKEEKQRTIIAERRKKK
jgi:hypothetical protein